MSKGKRILIAEDEKPIAKAMKLKLESSGFEVDSVFDGLEAIEKISQKGNVYDIMLLDIVMPNKDGFDVLKFMNENKVKLPPVFVLSNLSQEEDVKKAKNLGAKDFIIKSNTPINEIVEKIKKTL